MTDAWRSVTADMETRRRTGMDRYGKPVSPDDIAEDWLQHAYEEALDLAVYLKAELMRRAGPKGDVAAERERCAKIMESFGDASFVAEERTADETVSKMMAMAGFVNHAIAAAIRKG